MPVSLRDYATFMREFVREPRLTGAIVPSSQQLGTTMVGMLPLHRARTVVELGAGTGTFTQLIEPRLRPGAVFAVLERNERLARRLRKRCPSAVILAVPAESLPGELARLGRHSADCIISGLPWASFREEEQDRVLAAILEALTPGGVFCTFAYWHACWVPRARRFRKLLKSSFSMTRTTRVVWQNLPPALVYGCVK